MIGSRSHHLRFLARQSVEHRGQPIRRVHALTNTLSWIFLASALSASQVGLVFLGALMLYLLTLDVLVTMGLAGLLLAVWQVLPWGEEATPIMALGYLLAFGGVGAMALLAHTYHHEHASFIGEEGGGVRLVNALHVVLTGAVQFPLLLLLGRGYRPGLRAALLQAERDWLRGPGRGWHNWAENQRCAPRDVFVPESVAEVREIVAEATRMGRRLRVVGSGFSWSPLIPVDDVLLFTERLDDIEVDPLAQVVWCGPGAKNRDLNRAVERESLTLPYNVVLETVTAGGIIAAGTHGSGRDTGTLGDLLVALELVDANGQLRRYVEAETDPELWSALRASLGCFGVVVRIGLRLTRNHAWELRSSFQPMQSTLRSLAERVQSSPLYELYWFPAQQDLWVREGRPVEGLVPDHPRKDPLNLARQLAEHVFCRVLVTGIDRLAPRLYPWMMGRIQRLMRQRQEVVSNADVQHYRQWVEVVRCGCIEVGFKLDPKAERAERALAMAMDVVQRWGERGRFPLNLAVNVRFIGESGALMSPAYGAGATCFIEALCVGRPADWEAISSELMTRWLSIETAMPHWPKELPAPALSVTRSRFSERIARFREALQGSGVDPGGTFRNELVHALLKV